MSHPAAEVATVPSAAERNLQPAREARTMEILNQPGKSLAEFSEVEWKERIRLVQLAQARAHELFTVVLKEDIHYGHEKDKDGRPVFKKPILKKAGAQEVRKLMQWELRDMEAPIVLSNEHEVSVTVHVGVTDKYGRLVGSAQGVCHSKEKRFERWDGKGYTYKDPRAELHNITMMARKRASSAAICEAAGLTAFLASGEEAEAEFGADRVITPMSPEESARVKEAAQQKGLGRRAWEALCMKELGRTEVGSGQDVLVLLDAIGRLPERAAPVPTTVIPGGTRATDAPASPPAGEDHQSAAEAALEDAFGPTAARALTDAEADDDLPY